MNCSDFEKVVLVLANDRLIEVGRRAEALQHTETCALCASRLGEECALIPGVRAVRAEIANEKAPAHLESFLLSAFRERATGENVPVTGESFAAVSQSGQEAPRSHRLWTNWRVAAVAAAILLLTSIGAIVFVRFHSQSEPPGASAEQRLTPVPRVPDSTDPAPVTHETSDQLSHRPPGQRVAKHRAPKVERVTEFMSLNEGEDLESFEFVQVVRVELSASSLRDFGLPVSYGPTDELIKADLALGPDGIARAIRFVR
jgi:hypothetical protein